MEELASRTIWAVKLLVEALALLGLIVPGLVSSLFELVGAVSEGARIVVLARAVQLPEFADLSLEFHFEALFTVGTFLNRCRNCLFSIHAWIYGDTLGSFLLLSILL